MLLSIFKRSLFDQAKWAANPGWDDLTHICLVLLLFILFIKSKVSLLIRLKLSSWSWIPPLQLSQVHKRGFITFCLHALRVSFYCPKVKYLERYESQVKKIYEVLVSWITCTRSLHTPCLILTITPVHIMLQIMNSVNIWGKEAGIAFNNWGNCVCVNECGSDSPLEKSVVTETKALIRCVVTFLNL